MVKCQSFGDIDCDLREDKKINSKSDNDLHFRESHLDKVSFYRLTVEMKRKV